MVTYVTKYMKVRKILVSHTLSHTKITLKSHEERKKMYTTKCVINNAQEFLKKKKCSCKIL